MACRKLYCLWLMCSVLPPCLPAEEDCILGSEVVIERRRPERCCLNGNEYDRVISVQPCACTEDDFDWLVGGYSLLSLGNVMCLYVQLGAKTIRQLNFRFVSPVLG